jgi:phosphohistidine phosphatase
MILYLVRHAEALPVGGAIQRDVDRQLSPRGEEDAALMGKALAALDRGCGLILTSPLVRAVRTGEIFRNSFPTPLRARTSENLAPGFRYKALLEELSSEQSVPAVIAIGHQPDLGHFISFLIADATHTVVAMPACAVARIAFGSDDLREGATLQWLLTPEIIRATQLST